MFPTHKEVRSSGFLVLVLGVLFGTTTVGVDILVGVVFGVASAYCIVLTFDDVPTMFQPLTSF